MPIYDLFRQHQEKLFTAQPLSPARSTDSQLDASAGAKFAGSYSRSRLTSPFRRTHPNESKSTQVFRLSPRTETRKAESSDQSGMWIIQRCDAFDEDDRVSDCEEE
jgi:hypothetical protein